MKKQTHMKVVFIMKAVLFGLFFANVVRILMRTWKYGGSKICEDYIYDGDDIDPDDDPGTGED